MGNETWLNKEIDLFKSLEEKEYDLLVEYAYKNQQHILSRWLDNDMSSFQKIVRFGSSILRYFEQHLKAHSKILAIFRLGALQGTLESFERISYEERQDEWADKMFKNAVISIKHLDDIILTLEVYGVMTHSELCRNLNLKESTLSEIMKKVDYTKLIKTSRLGKYKLYMLSDDGRRLGKQLRKQRHENIEEKEILLQLKDYLNSVADKKGFKFKLNEILGGKDDIINTPKLLNPGDSLSIFYGERGEIARDNYKILGFIMDKKINDASIQVMAEKQKLDLENVSNIYNPGNKEAYI